MCLPLSCLKCMVTFQAFITLALGLAALVVSTIIQIRVNQAYDYFNGYSESIGKSLIITMWTFTSFLIVFGLMGVIGSLKKIKCLLFLYNITNFIGFAAFLIFGITALVVGAKIDHLSNDTCLTAGDWSTNLTDTYVVADQVFCQAGCQCYIKDPTLAVNNSLTNYTTISTSKNVIRVQDCPGININEYQTQANFLNFAETTFSCAGWCSGQTYYTFSDVNSIVPQSGNGGCYKKTIGWFANNAYLLGEVSMGIMGVLGLFMVFTCCLCFHKDKPQGNFYARMAYYDEQN